MATEGQRRRRRRQRQRRRAAAQQAAAAPPRNQLVARTTGGREVGPAPPVNNRGRRRNRQRGGGWRNNVYLRTLLEPAKFPGVKVPDADAFPSAAFFATVDTTLTTDATGRVAYAVVPEVNDALLRGVWNTGTARFDWTVQDLAQVTTLQGLYGRARPVSAQVQIQFIGTTQNDSGMISAYLVPRSINIANSWSTAIAQFTSQTLPLRDGISMTWRPTDNADLEYDNTTISGWQTGPDYNPHRSGMAIFIEGAAVSTTVAMVRVHINFEGIATTDTLGMITPSNSPSDVGMYEQALGLINSIPVANPLTSPIINTFLASAAGGATLYAQNLIRQQAGLGAIGFGV